MASLPDLCESAFFDLYESAPPAELADYGLVRQKDYDPQEDRPLPFILFAAGVKEAKRRPQPGVFDVFLSVYIATSAIDDPEGDAHEAAINAFFAHINDIAAVKTAINETPALMLYHYSLESQATRTVETGEWESEIVIKVVCQAR